MVSKRDASKETFESSNGDAVEQVLVSLLVYADTQLFIEKGMMLTWKEIKDIFGGDFQEDLEDWQVYVNIHQSGLHKISCRYFAFPCADIIHWIVSHTDPETMTLSNATGTQLSIFKTKNYHQMYHLPQSVNHMDELFYTTQIFVKAMDIIKCWVKEESKFRSMPNHVYKTKSLKKVYQFLIIFAWRLYSQKSTKAFPKNWVVVLDQLVNDGKHFN